LNELLAEAPLGTDTDLPGPSVLGFLACAAIVRRRPYLDAGGFHPRFGVGGEEQLLALDLLSAGWGLSYVARVVAFHWPERDDSRQGRPVRQWRNDVWTVWLRRRPRTVVRVTGTLLASAARQSDARKVVLNAVGGLPWVLRQRRAVSADLERRIRVAERSAGQAS
jgi:hypothetical protein